MNTHRLAGHPGEASKREWITAMKSPFDLKPEDFAKIPPGPPAWFAQAQRASEAIADHLLRHPEEIRDILLKDPITGEPLKSGKPTTPAISETRRRAARARWDAPREKSTRVTVTLPPDVAKKLHAAATAAKKPTSHLVAKCIEIALPSILLDTLAGDAK